MIESINRIKITKENGDWRCIFCNEIQGKEKESIVRHINNACKAYTGERNKKVTDFKFINPRKAFSLLNYQVKRRKIKSVASSIQSYEDLVELNCTILHNNQCGLEESEIDVFESSRQELESANHRIRSLEAQIAENQMQLQKQTYNRTILELKYGSRISDIHS